MVDINWLDAGFALALTLFTVRGLLRGMIKEVAGLISVVLAFFISARYYPQVATHLEQWVGNPQWRIYASYGVVFSAVVAVVALIAAAVQRFMTMTMISWLDHAAGGVAGLAKGALLCSVGLALLQKVAPESPFLRNSQLAGYLDQITAFASHFLPAMNLPY